MYDYIPYILAAAFVVLGLIMAIIPEKCTKKENRDSEEAVKKTRRSGGILIIAGAIFAAASYLMK